MKSLLAGALGADTATALMSDGLRLFVVRILGLALSFVSTVVLARTLGASEYGIYALAFVILSIVSLPVQLGLPALVSRETPRLREAGNWAQLSALWHWAMRLIFGASVIIVAVVIVWIFWLSPDMDDGLRATLLIGLPLIPLLAMIAVLGGAIRGLQFTAAGQFAEEMVRPFILTAALLVLLVLIKPTAGLAIGVHAAAALIAVVVAVWVLRTHQPIQIAKVERGRASARAWLRSVVPLSLISSVYLLNQSTDILMIGYLRDTVDVGLYRVALAGLALGLFALRAMDILMGPQFARLLERGDMRALARLASLSASFSFLISAPVVVLFWLFGPALIGWIFGAEYGPSFYPLAILLTAQTAAALIGPNSVVLIMGRQEKAALIAMVVATVVNIGLNAYFIPAFGIVGAAIATAIAIFARSVFLWIVARRLLGIDASVLTLLRRTQ